MATAAGLGHGVVAAVLGRCLRISGVRRPFEPCGHALDRAITDPHAVVMLAGLAVGSDFVLPDSGGSMSSSLLTRTSGDGGIGELEHAPSIAHVVASRN